MELHAQRFVMHIQLWEKLALVCSRLVRRVKAIKTAAASPPDPCGQHNVEGRLEILWSPRVPTVFVAVPGASLPGSLGPDGLVEDFNSINVTSCYHRGLPVSLLSKPLQNLAGFALICCRALSCSAPLGIHRSDALVSEMLHNTHRHLSSLTFTHLSLTSMKKYFPTVAEHFYAPLQLCWFDSVFFCHIVVVFVPCVTDLSCFSQSNRSGQPKWAFCFSNIVGPLTPLSS